MNEKKYDMTLPLPPDFVSDIRGKFISFDGNGNIKPKDCVLPLTKEHLEEYVRCANDIFYFAERYYSILSLDFGMQKITLRGYQRELIQTFIDNRHSICLASRQSGKSTCFEVYVCWYILFNKDKNVALLANKATNSADLLRKVKNAYELLPKWLQQGVRSWNSGSIRLENGCSIITSSSSSSSIRSKSINLLIVDETAFIPNNVFNAFYASTYPTIASGKTTKVIFISTPNGLNHYYKLWKDAERGENEFKTYRVDYWQVPGRDEQWKADTIKNIGERNFAQEFGNDFLGSSHTLIEASYLPKLTYENPIVSPLYNILNEKYVSMLRVFEDPIPGHYYTMSIDSAKMTEESNSDSLCIQIIDMTCLPYKQVCTFSAERGISYLQIPDIANQIGKAYNWAFCFVENNDVGQEVANILANDLEYENIYFEKPGIPGFRTTKRTKRIGCVNLKALIERDMMKVVDFKTISELSTFIKKRESYSAEKGMRDDTVMALIGTLFFMQIAGFDNIPDKTVFIKQLFDKNEITKAMMEDLPAFGGMGHVDVDDTEMSVF